MIRMSQNLLDRYVEQLMRGDQDFLYDIPFGFKNNLFLYRIDGGDAYQFGIMAEPIADIGTYNDIMRTRLDVRLLSPRDWPSDIIKL